MGFRFRKRIKIAPGIRLNLSKSGTSLSVGKPGATFNFGSRGERITTGVPGTGISYSKQLGHVHLPKGGRGKPMFLSYVLAVLLIAWVLVRLVIH